MRRYDAHGRAIAVAVFVESSVCFMLTHYTSVTPLDRIACVELPCVWVRVWGSGVPCVAKIVGSRGAVGGLGAAGAARW